jgi:hypothetical protein
MNEMNAYLYLFCRLAAVTISRCHSDISFSPMQVRAGLSIDNSLFCLSMKYFALSSTLMMANLYLLAIVFSLVAVAVETPHRRTYFYVGGNYTLNNDGEHIITNQMYVERLTPVDGPRRQYPIVFIHGADQTATVRPLLV